MSDAQGEAARFQRSENWLRKVDCLLVAIVNEASIQEAARS